MTVPVSQSKRDLIGSVVERLHLYGGRVPDSEVEFWRELAAHLGLLPKSKDLSRVAQAVLGHLDEEWDDDFVEEDGSLSHGLYETIVEAVRRSEESKARREPMEEEEDDDEGLTGFRADLHITPVNHSLQSVYEWIKDGVLVLSPEWQRNFVWKSKKQKRLIESILLGLPIPSFLIFQDSVSGRKYVIDGRQRLETIARFKTPKRPRGDEQLRFKTFARKEPSWGPGEPLEDAAGKYYADLPLKHKTAFDSAPLVLAEFRDIPLGRLYQLFKRYNTGAVALNAAEIRNAVYQASPLHAMMFRVGGEQRSGLPFVDQDEEQLSTDLRETMQNKVQRYGAYDFIGRYFAFAYGERGGSVARATLDFMDRFDSADTKRIEQFRREFMGVFRSAQRWYGDSFLTDPEEQRFHSFLATLQLVSTKFMIEAIDGGRTTEQQVVGCVNAQWPQFARNRLERKQNSTLFWGSQKTWISLLESELGLSRKYPEWDWKGDLEVKEDSEVAG